MRFEYDPEKSTSNVLKHNIDFEEAQALWKDSSLLEIEVAYEGEARFVMIGSIRGKHWTAVVTFRAGIIRIISVRRSRKKEVTLYDQEN